MLSPADAMHCVSLLSKPRLATFHPVAVAAAICSPNRFRDEAVEGLLELRHPKSIGSAARSETALRIEEDFRARLFTRISSLLERAGHDPKRLLATPEPLPDALTFCPRCRMQFVHANGDCDRCVGVALKTFPRDRDAALSTEHNEPRDKKSSVMANESA